MAIAKLPTIPAFTSDAKSLAGAMKQVQQALQILANNQESTNPAFQIFALAGSSGKLVGFGSNVHTTAATVNLYLPAPANVLVFGNYQGGDTSATKNLLLTLDGNQVMSVAIPAISGVLTPQMLSTQLLGLGAGTHVLALTASATLTGFNLTAMAFAS